MNFPPTITIIGSGNVAEILGQRFIDEGLQVVSVVGRNEERIAELGNKWSVRIENLEEISGEFILVCLPVLIVKKN